ncbi:MAG: metal-binding protein [Snowella sp.]|nr:metal-binding protein [Snowella sp.]
MPSGRTHDRITVWSVPLIVGLTYGVTRSGQLTVLVMIAFLFSGLMFGPDLDIYSVQYKRWGWLRWIWIPYRSLIRHRSVLSHGFLIGTLLRLVYLSLIAGIVLGILIAIAALAGYLNIQQLAKLSEALTFSQKHYGQTFLALLIGLELGAMSHYLSDWIGSRYKQLQKSKTRSRPTHNARSKNPKKKKSKL